MSNLPRINLLFKPNKHLYWFQPTHLSFKPIYLTNFKFIKLIKLLSDIFEKNINKLN